MRRAELGGRAKTSGDLKAAMSEHLIFRSISDHAPFFFFFLTRVLKLQISRQLDAEIVLYIVICASFWATATKVNNYLLVKIPILESSGTQYIYLLVPTR